MRGLRRLRRILRRVGPCLLHGSRRVERRIGRYLKAARIVKERVTRICWRESPAGSHPVLHDAQVPRRYPEHTMLT